MAVYFIEPLVLSRDGKTLQCCNRDILAVGCGTKETIFSDWYGDYSINPTTFPLPTLVKSQSDDIFVVIPKYYDNDGFNCIRIVVPENQFVNVLHVEERVLHSYADQYCDVLVCAAKQNDIFCFVNGIARSIHVLLADGPRKTLLTETSELPEIIEELKEKGCTSRVIERQLERFLSEKTFNNLYWRELRPRCW